MFEHQMLLYMGIRHVKYPVKNCLNSKNVVNLKGLKSCEIPCESPCERKRVKFRDALIYI